MRFSLSLALAALFTSSVVAVRDVINGVALNGGSEFSDPNSYQSKALAYVESTHSNKNNAEVIQYYALACIFYASSGISNKRTDAAFPQFPTNGLPQWIDSTNWVTGADKCSWFGITCNGNRVSEIELNNNRLFGIFAPEVSLLASSLEVIDLYSNFYLVTENDAGNEWMAKMTNLRDLFFGTTSFEYDGVPTFLGALTNLEEIDISNSFFTRGPIRAEAFQGLTNLEYIDMADNIYTSTIPAAISNLPALQYLYIDNVNFLNVDQTLDFLIGMPAIFENWMDFTAFTGGIPTGIGTLSTLRSWSCTFCTLKGTIPTEIGNMANLDRMWLYQNELTGTIPTEIGRLNRMQFLHLEGNNLGGNMPQQICNNRSPLALITELGSDCDGQVTCSCCTCCGGSQCDNFSDGTPNPTAAPTTGSPPVAVIDVPPGLCFSGDSTVETVEYGPTPLNKLQIGDMVKSGDVVEPVYSFGHNAKDMMGDFVQIHADGLDKPLELSKNHMLFTEGGSIPASNVVVGDKVAVAEGGFAEVSKVKNVSAKGIYAPFTPSGKIAVNGFMASNYITFQDESESLLIGGFKVINMHWVSHIFMAPHRLVCQFNFDMCKSETYTDGMNSWMVEPLRFTLNVLEQSALVKAAVFVPTFSFVCVAFAVEQMISSPLMVALGAVAVFFYMRKSKKASA